MTRAGGGSGGQSAYNSQIATLVGGTSVADGVNPFIEVTYTSATQSGGTQVTTNTTTSGANTSTLTIRSDRVGTQTAQCRLTHPTSADSPILSDVVNFETISAINLSRSIINYEVCLDTSYLTFTPTVSQNLFLSSLQLGGFIDNPTRAIIIYPSEENVPVKITMAGSAGQSFNGNAGGQGGSCIFTYTLKKNVEYVFKLGCTVEPTSSIGRGGAGAYFYEKGRLLVACGGGGASGWSGGTGGAGGGAGIAGANGSGTGGGKGGIKANDGQLPSAGLLPSGISAGKVESCTTGVYWKNQGISPCSDVGQQRFRDANGNEVSNSSLLQRGYKSASTSNYGFRHNGGNSATSVSGVFVGGGGSGTYGGNAASNASSGGGGASGYTNGSVSIISSNQGGNPSNLCFANIEVLT
jgi:hypothetical protein